MLLDKSQEAFLISLELYNKPTIKYRIESFCFFYTNAWELLLKAYLLESTKKENSIFYPGLKGEKRRSIALRDALNRIFPNTKDPIRKNVEDVADLRDEATHLIIHELEAIYVGLFQAGVLNYIEKLKEWFGISVTDKISPAMLSLIFDLEKVDPIILKKKYGKGVAEFIGNKMRKIDDSVAELKDKRYCISIEYKLALVKNPKDADITLSSGPEGKASGTIIRVPKDPKLLYPYRQKDCIALIKKGIGEKVVFNSHDFRSILYKENIIGNEKYYYRYEPFGHNAYSQELVDFVIAKIQSNSDYLAKARGWFKSFLQKRRQK
jgi:hypothetical protein